MSGYRHSGLDQQSYEDREKLREAVEVIERRWPIHRNATGELLRRLQVRIEEEAGNG